ncbi:hypothetical protein [Halanaerobium congolense]|jgi:hypothetical protein|uniref:hypothetical protein n=1 Tax=Halanaerobium congolense TaxID=54121 RepID=UPI00088F54BB|nr:hypothetical protein [Halanaerobium congolense]SDK65776.1 hypothetical protein SAMN04515655_11023 [Halanaerobium congolense]SDM32155.1 hypothetical protein SAMN04488599_10923 [Halanaerobium congolense]
MSNYLKVKKFSEIEINDPFFDSLKSDYAGFEDWFSRKVDKKAYTFAGCRELNIYSQVIL